MNTVIGPGIPSPLRRTVERAAEVMEQQLAPLGDFDITARWRFDGGSQIALDLIVTEPGGRHAAYHQAYPVTFFDGPTVEIRRGLGPHIDQLLEGLREVTRAELTGIRKRLAEMRPLSGGE